MAQVGAYTIHKVEIQLLINDGTQNWVVSPNKLRDVPRIGETLYVPTFTRDHIGASYFRVHELIHDISEGKHVIEIHASN